MPIRPLSECKVVTFLEDNHYHPQTAEAMNNLLPFFKEQNFKVLCLESSRTNLADELIAQRKDTETADLLSMVAIKEADREKYSAMFSAESARLNILESLDEGGMQYCGMDIKISHKDNMVSFFSASEKRSVHMADKIAESCEMGDVLALVGFGHYNIRDKLIEKGLLEGNIKGYYIPNNPIPTDTMRISFYERELRSIEHDYAANSSASTLNNILTIDFLKDTNLNVTAIILNDYSYYLLGQPSHVEL